MTELTDDQRSELWMATKLKLTAENVNRIADILQDLIHTLSCDDAIAESTQHDLSRLYDAAMALEDIPLNAPDSTIDEESK